MNDTIYGDNVPINRHLNSTMSQTMSRSATRSMSDRMSPAMSRLSGNSMNLSTSSMSDCSERVGFTSENGRLDNYIDIISSLGPKAQLDSSSSTKQLLLNIM